MDFIAVPLIIGIITLGIYKLFELFVCKNERMALIEKFSDKLSANDICSQFSFNINYSKSRFNFNALKGGLLMMGIGLGLILAFFICINAYPNYTNPDLSWNVQNQASVVYGACILLFGGLGLLAAFLIELNISKKDKKDKKD